MPEKQSTFDIRDYGASTENALNTDAIQNAINACHQARGGTVLCPSGCFITGTLMMKSNVELHLAAGCRLKGSKNLHDYIQLEGSGFITHSLPEKSGIPLIGAVEAQDIAITGNGTIDGSGIAFYDPEKTSPSGKYDKPDTPRPRIMMLYNCHNLRIENVSLVDSPCWTIWLMQCENVNVRNVKINGDPRMRNNDGIDIDSCKNVCISDCFMDTEDDCIAVRAMQRRYEPPQPCENITVTNCILESRCQGIRVGCPGDGVIRNCMFSNLVINGSNGIIIQNPHRYLPENSDGDADISNLFFSNIAVQCSKIPIWISVEEGIRLKRLSDLHFSDIKIKSGSPCTIQGSRETTVEDVFFSSIDIKTTGDDAVICRNCRGVRLNNVMLSNEPDV